MVSSDDDYMRIGACSVLSDSDDDFDNVSAFRNCDSSDADSEELEEPSPRGNPVDATRPKQSCIQRGPGRRSDDGRHVSLNVKFVR